VSILINNAQLHRIFYSYQGDKGYCYVPYEYMANKKLCNEAWTVKKLAVEDMGQDVWEEDDEVDYLEDEEDEEEDDDDEDDADIEEVEEEDESDNEDD
jgi:hypothetical protein